MPRNTGVDILNIKPDPEMGYAQNSNIPVVAVALDQVNKANDELRVYDHQINLMKYQRKLRNQDKLLEALENDQVSVGDIEPEDKSYFDEAEKKAHEAYLAVKDIEPDENGQNPKYADYKNKIQDLKDTQKVLNLRRVALQSLRKELASTASPNERKAREAHLAKMKAQDPFQTVTPYQKSLTVDLDETIAEIQKGALISKGEAVNIPSTTRTVKDANGKITTTVLEKPAATGKPTTTKSSVKQTTVGADGYLNTEIEIEPEKKWVLSGMVDNATQMYLDGIKGGGTGEGFAKIQGAFDMFDGNPDDAPKKYLQQMNKRLVDFHTQNQIGTIKIPGNPGPVNPDNPNDPTGRVTDTGEYPHQINYRILPDGTIRISDSVPEFAAKLALANVAGDYVIKAKKGFDEAAFKLNMEMAKNKADILLQGARAQTERAKGAWYWSKVAGMNDDEEKTKAINDGYKYNLTTQSALAVPVKTATGGSYQLTKIPANKTTPILTWSSAKDGVAAKPSIIKPIGSKTIYGTDPANPGTYGKPIGYVGGYYDQEYIFDGKPVSNDVLITMYNKFKKDTPAWDKGFDEFLKAGINNDWFDVKIIGENGSTTREVHTQALKAISNTNSKKGQDQPFYEAYENE